MKQNLLFNQASALGKRLAMVLTMLLIVGIGQAWGENFKTTYDYSTKGNTWTLTDCEDKSSYWLCPASGTSSVATISDIFTGNNITSDVTITINNATYGSGNGASSTTFKIYNSSACTTQVTASQSGTLASSSTYVNTIYTVTEANAANFSKDLVLLITKPGKQIRLKSITVEFSYETAAPAVKHKAYFYNGTTLLNTGGTEFTEGAAVSYSGSTPTSCDGESVTFVGWATSTWEGKVAKGDITPDFYDIIAGEDLPKMGTIDVSYYAVFARETSTTTNKTLTLNSTNLSSAMGGSYSSNDFSYSGISFGRSNAAIMSNTIQIKGGTSNAVWNKTELPGAITSITVTKKTNNSVLTVGTLTKPTTNSDTVSSTTTYTFTESNNYRYFKIAATSSYTQVASVIINYSATSSTYSDYITLCSTETLVSLHPNGGTPDEVKTYTTEETSYTLPECPFTRTGYTFANWNTEENGTGISYNTGATIDLDGTDVNLYAQWTCETPVFDIKIKDDNPVVFLGESIELTVVGSKIAADATCQWYKKNGESYDELAGETTNKLTIAEATANDAGNYKCKVTNGTCFAENNFTVKMYRLRGLKDDTWNIDYVFEKTNDNKGVYSLELNGATPYEFKIHDGSAYYGNTGDDPTMTSGNCTNWEMEENMGKNVELQTTITGTYTFTLDYQNKESRPLISVTYPSKQTIYFKPATSGTWADDAKFTIYSWGSGDPSYTPLQDKDCGGIYSAEISTTHTSLLFIKASTYKENFENITAQTIDLTAPTGDKVLYDMASTTITHLYLKPNEWSVANAWFATYLCNGSEAASWHKMTILKDEDNNKEDIYSVEIGSDKLVPSKNKNIIFVRKNPSNTGLNWNDVWNQTADLNMPTNGNNFFSLNDGDWSNGTWSTIYDNSKWTTYIPNHTVSFNANGHGTAPEDQCITDGGKVTQPTAPTATGYTFGGWYKEAGCTNEWDFANDVVTSDITLYAQWTANIHTLTWNVNGGDALTGTYTSGSVAYGTVIVPPATPTRTGCTFLGWKETDGSTTVAETMPDKDLTYTAQWKLIPTLSWSAPTCTVTIASESNIFPTLTATPDAIKSGVKFESSEPTVATINANGDIILKSEGTTTIKAYYEEDATYAAAEATYELTVVESTNCRWEEVTIDDIEYGDEVVIATFKNGYTYALKDGDGGASSAPPAVEIKINQDNTINTAETTISNALIWNIDYDKEDTKNLVIYSTKNAGKWLYSTNANDGVRIGDNTNKEFKIMEGTEADAGNFFLYHIAQARYLGVYYQGPDWRGYTTINCQITGQTLKFYKRVCLPEGQYWVKWMVNGQEYTVGNPTTKVVAGGQVVKLPTIPDDYQLPGCTSKKFIGWTTDEILVEADDAPTMFTDAASSPAISTNQTFHALFADVEEGETTYEKVTTISEGTYLMATITADQYKTKSTLAYTGKTVDNENRGGVVKVTISDGVIGVKPEAAKEITVTLGTEDDANYFAMFDGEYYITQTEKNKFTFASEVSYEWSLNANGQIKQKSVYDGKDDIRIYMNNGNSGAQTEYFCPYAAKSEGYNSGTYYYHAYLFKKIGGMSYSNYVTQCCTPWTAPTLLATTSIAVDGSTTITHSGTTHGAVTYTSSNTDIATVDANGKVTGLKPGKATITATWDGVDGVNNYCPAETTIDITVRGSFTITYDANDALATGNTESTVIEYPDGKGTVANNGFALDGHEFVKWNTATDGSGYDYTEGASITLTDNLTLYAIWQPNQYDITVNVVGGSITLGTKTITTANTPQTITDVVAHGQSFSFTNATPDAAYETPYTVTLVRGTATVTSSSLTISNVQSDLEITIEYALKPVYTITYNIPEGGGELAADAVTSIYKGGSITLPGIKDGTISSEYSCEEFIGWTTLTSYESYEGAIPTPFYNAGDELSGITEATTLRPVYSRAGNGPSGTVELTCTDVATWKSDVLGGNNNSYGTIITRTATDGSAWTTDGMIQNAGGISLSGNHYIQIPTLPGPITNIIMKVSQGNLENDDACYEYIANTTSRAFHFRSAADGSNLFTSNVELSRSRTIEITEGNYTTGYIINGEGTSHVHAITVAYGSPNIISTSLNCSNDIDEFTITYNTNYGSARGQIPTGTVVNGACDNSGEPIRFEDLPNGEYTICNSLTATQYKLVGWNSQANGNGGLSYEPGDVITMVPQSDITLYAQWVPEVIMLDNQDRTITYQETVGEAITLPAGAYTCDDKYTFVGWTTDNVDSWNQKITKPTLVAELDGNDETLFVPTEPTVVYAVYKLESTANSKAFYLKSGNYYAQKHNTYVLKGTSNIADATRLYRQQINVESPNNYWLYYLDDEQQKRFVYINTSNLGSLFIPSIGDGETTPEDTEGWEFVSVTGGYKLKALGNYDGSTQYMRTVDSGNMGSNTTGSVYTIETATEINYYAYPTCSDEITITFETRGGTLIPNDHPYVLTKKEGDVVTLPGCEYAGLDFIGWVDEPIEPTEIIANPEDIYEAEEEYVVGNQNIVLYAYYSQTPESAEYDGNSDGEWKIYAFADGEYHFAVAPDSEEGEMSTVTICDKSTTWTFTNVAENQYYIQDEAGRYVGVRPAIENKNDFRFTDEPVIWTIESKGDDLYRLTCETNTDRVMLYDNGRIRYSSHTQEEKPGYLYVTIGGCFNPIYTTDPARLQAVSVYGTVQITSTLGQTVKAMDKLTLVVRHAEPESYIRFSSPNVTFYDESGNVITTALVESQKQQIPLVVAYTPDVADNSIARPAITVTAKTLNPSTGTYVETNYSVNGRISARSLPADFAIVAKVGNLWYALPSQGLNSTDALVGYPVEVDNQNDPTAVTAVPENADWSLRQVYAASHSDALKDRFKQYGANIMFENNASPAKMLNASASDNYLLTNAEYDNYKQSDNQGLYEWTPTTTDLETYTLTNAGRTDKKLNVSFNTVFGVHTQNVATNSLRFLPIDERYTPLALQVVEWKENSIVVMYNGDPEQTASVSVNGGAAQTTTLSAAQRDIAVYELTATGLAANPTQRLSITIDKEKMLLPIPYIVNSNTTDATLTGNNKTLAAVSDLVVLNGKTLTADAATASKYTFRNVTIYGGGSLIIPSGKGLGVNSLTMRVGAVVDDNYQNLYPSMLLAGTINTGNINIDYLTTADYYYPLSVPEEVTIRDIKYPVDIYGSNVDKANTGSFRLKYYNGAQRVEQGSQYGTGWVVVNEDETKTLTPNQGYAIWGIPKKVSVNSGAKERQKYGIHRIPISTTADKLATNEKTNAEVQITAYGDASTPPNDRGWNYLGNPYLAQLGGMDGDDEDLQMGLLEQEKDANGDWTGGWVYNNEQVRYITVTNDCQNFDPRPVADATIPAFSTFFIQASQDGAILLTAPANPEPASIAARHYAAQKESAKEITTGIILTGNDQTDRTGLLIADIFTEEYDFNADLSKFENSGINLYTIGKDGKLAFMAINQALAEQPIPLGYGAPADGEYTIAFDEDRYNATDISALYLIDYDRNETTNLLHTDYSFVTTAGTNNERFALQVAFIPQNATSVEWVDDATIQVAVDGNNLLLNNLPSDAGVQVFDALGRVLYATLNAPTEMQITLPTGYYLVRIADKQHAVVINTVIP